MIYIQNTITKNNQLEEEVLCIAESHEEFKEIYYENHLEQFKDEVNYCLENQVPLFHFDCWTNIEEIIGSKIDYGEYDKIYDEFGNDFFLDELTKDDEKSIELIKQIIK